MANKTEQPQKKPKQWLIMVYMAGARDVSDEARESLLRMKQIGSTGDVDVVAQFDSGTEGTCTRRYCLQTLDNAMEIETVLRQACDEIPNTPARSLPTAGNYYYTRLLNLMPKSQADSMTASLQPGDMIELLQQNPDRLKNVILDCILNDDVVGRLGNTNAGEPCVLRDFIRWAKIAYPARKTMVIVWGHGNGLSVAWDIPPLPFFPRPDALAAVELPKAFGSGSREPGDGRVNIVGFNSCSLGTIEVYCQLDKIADYGVASEGFMPNTSWPYDRILGELTQPPGKAPKELADTIVTQYLDYYRDSVIAAEHRRNVQRAMAKQGLGAGLDLEKGLTLNKGPYLNQPPDENKGPYLNMPEPNKGPRLGVGLRQPLEGTGVDLWVCEIAEIGQVTQAIKKLVELLRDKLSEPVYGAVLGAIVAAHGVSQSYFNKDFVDVHDFCRVLREFSSDANIRDACSAVMKAVVHMFPNPNWAGKDVRNSHGLSVFFPWGDWDRDEGIDRYTELNFAKQSGWGRFLKQYRKLLGDLERPKPVDSRTCDAATKAAGGQLS